MMRQQYSTTRVRCAAPKLAGLLKHNGAVAVHDDAVFQVRPHRPRKHNALKVLALADEVGHAVPVGHASHVLLDNRPRVCMKRNG